MNAKKYLETRIRGWLPTNPTLSHQHQKTTTLKNTEVLANPLPTLFEKKFQRNTGILIGFGIGLLALGFGGAALNHHTYVEVQRVLSYQGIGTDNYLFRDLLDQTAFYLSLATGGIFLTVLGAISPKTQIFREATLNNAKHPIGNFLFGFGSGLTIISFRSLFLYLLAPNDPILNYDNYQLKVFAGFFVVGACLFATGILSWRRKK
jgi:hypothetical protein